MKESFDNYVKSFDLKDDNIIRKIEHSKRVADLSSIIAYQLNWNEEGILLANKIGLIHDIGRFQEWEYHKSFISGKFDHGEYGVEILKKNDFYKKFDIEEDEKNNVFNAIYYHNKLTVPESKNNEYIKLIRDADKIDILYLQSSRYLIPANLKDLNISPKVLKTFENETPIKVKDLKTKGDYVLFVLAFIYDVNYRYSFKIIYEKKYLDGFYNLIEHAEIYQEYFNKIKAYIEMRLKNVRR